MDGFSIPVFMATMLVALFGMGWHEYGHALMAHYWGDPTPARMKRLTPNPLVHINPGGFLFYLMMTLSFVNGFGRIGPLLIGLLLLVSFIRTGNMMSMLALGSVPINVSAMRDPRWGNFWTSFAGPLMNLAQAIIAALILRLVFSVEEAFALYTNPSSINTPVEFLIILLLLAIFTNIAFFIFNLIPLAPLDGWNMMLALLPGRFLHKEQVPNALRKNVRQLAQFLQQPAYKWRDWYQISYIVFVFLFIAPFFVPQFNVLSSIIMPPWTTLVYTLLGF
jgi:Zn-dependent protease